jgi:hypothetical protein
MIVSYKRSGGFAPMPVSCVLDTETCPPDEAQELERLVTLSGVMQATSRRTEAARDVRLHTLNINDNGIAKEVSWDDINIPVEARSLIQFMQSRAKSMLFGDDD